MLSPLLIKLSLTSLGSIGISVGAYFVYKNISSNSKEDKTKVITKTENGVSPSVPSSNETTSQGVKPSTR